MRASVSELRIPADAVYVVVAKRAAAGFGVVAGLDISAVDDLVIAVAQACENAIRCAAEAGTTAQIRLAFTLQGERLEVQVHSTCSREGAEARAVAPAARVAPAGEPAGAGAAPRQASRDLALRVMGLFVDDCHYRVNERTGGLRVRLTKYRIS